MSRLSDEKKNRIKEEILRVLYENSPKAMPTFFISNAVIRDNEFVLGLLKDMEGVGLIDGLRRKGEQKKIRVLWRMAGKTFREYQKLAGGGIQG